MFDHWGQKMSAVSLFLQFSLRKTLFSSLRSLPHLQKFYLNLDSLGFFLKKEPLFSHTLSRVLYYELEQFTSATKEILFSTKTCNHTRLKMLCAWEGCFESFLCPTHDVGSSQKWKSHYVFRPAFWCFLGKSFSRSGKIITSFWVGKTHYPFRLGRFNYPSWSGRNNFPSRLGRHPVWCENKVSPARERVRVLPAREGRKQWGKKKQLNQKNWENLSVRINPSCPGRDIISYN